MSRSQHPIPPPFTPAQRHDQIAEILARAVARLHDRAALVKLPTSPESSPTGLDSCPALPLTGARGRHNR